MEQNLKKIFFICLVTSLICGCARNISPNAYDDRSVGETASVYDGVIVRVRKVTVGSERLEDNKTGALTGALAGAALGSAFGGGNAKYATAGLGAVAGGFAGAYAENSLKSQEGLEYTIKLNTGETKVVVQGLDSPLYNGQPVSLVISRQGRARVVAR